jgi:hypothetical protein
LDRGEVPNGIHTLIQKKSPLSFELGEKRQKKKKKKEGKAYLKGYSILPLFFVSIINYIINNITYLW